MSIENLLILTMDSILSCLDSANIIYTTPIDYLEYLENNKSKNTIFSNEDWQIIIKEKKELNNLKKRTSDAIKVIENLKRETNYLLSSSFYKK